jgi:hypothetical protein
MESEEDSEEESEEDEEEDEGEADDADEDEHGKAFTSTGCEWSMSDSLATIIWRGVESEGLLTDATRSQEDHQVDQGCADRRGILRISLPRHGRPFRSAHGGQAGRVAHRKRSQ